MPLYGRSITCTTGRRNICWGLNFHTGESAPKMPNYTTPYYSAFARNFDKPGVRAFPMAYAIKMFNLGGHGKSVPVSLESKTKSNFDGYAFVDGDRSMYITLINKNHDEVIATLRAPTKGGSWERADLVAPNNDISVKTGLTIAGTPIGEDGNWDGHWQKTELGDNKITLAPVSATVLHWIPTP